MIKINHEFKKTKDGSNEYIPAVERIKAIRASGTYSTKIIKAGALPADTKTLLSHWDTSSPVQDNLDRIRRENLLGKASRSRVDGGRQCERDPPKRPY